MPGFVGYSSEAREVRAASDFKCLSSFGQCCADARVRFDAKAVLSALRETITARVVTLRDTVIDDQDISV